jgi:flagellar hook-associated protein 3 FlgL
MSLRITSSMMSHRVLADLQRSYTQMSTTQAQISSGYRVNQPSDDPLAAAQSRLAQSQLDGIGQSQKGVDSSTTWLTAAEAGLSSVADLLKRAKELAVKGATGTTTQDGRNAIAAEIDQLASSAKDAVNARSGDQYVFSGTATNTQPYAAATGDAYQGDDGAALREIGSGVTIQVNPQLVPVNPSPAGTTLPLNGRAVLGAGGTGAASDGRVLSVLRDLALHLRGGSTADLAALSTTDQAAIDTNVTAISTARSAVGSTQNRVDAASERLAQLEETGTKVLTDLTGTDMAKAITDFTTQQTAYQAALKAGAQIIQPSLLDFLR